MKLKQKKSIKTILSDKIADALTVKPGADIEDDQVFGTKPKTVSRADFNASGSEDETAISDFRKRNVHLLSDISSKYGGQVISRKELQENESYEESDSEDSEQETNLLHVRDLALEDTSESSNDSSAEIKENSKQYALQKSLQRPSGSDVESDDSLAGKSLFSRSTQIANDSDLSSSGSESDDYGITQFTKQIQASKTKSTGKTSLKQPSTLNNQSDSDELSSNEKKSNKFDIFQLQKQIHGSKGPQKTPKLKNKQQNNKELDSEDLSSDEGESDDYSIIQLKKQIESSDDDENGEHGEESSSEKESTEGDKEGYDISQMDEPMEEEFQHVKKQNVSEEVKKGNCVRNQLLLWEGLLEMRIHLQRCLNTANQMALPDTHQQLKVNDEFTEECNVTKANIATVLDKFLMLQDMLYKNFPETKNLSKKQSKEATADSKEESDEEIPSDTENEEIPSDTDNEGEGDNTQVESLKNNPKTTTVKKRKLEDYEQDLSTSHKAFKPFRDSTIQKWNEKTRLATATNIKNTPTNTIIQQISYILSDREKLVRRTQLKRSEYDIIGYKKEDKTEANEETNPVSKGRKDDDEYIPEIFDDSDFYHQLLRELIECKSADISDPVQLSRQWIALQQMRSKMKRKVDTKATKGRKIKYVVHNPLVNFMAPEKCTTMTDESINELFSSLFGKMFEHNNVGV